MSIKKLFDSTNKSRNYLSDTDTKSAFKDVESDRNIRAIKTKQDEFVPQVDYSEPQNFARYGSAYLYYKSAIEYIYDYYPYDGSDAEINEFYNKLLGIEKYIFNNLYPRTNGYIHLSADGWGTQTSITGGYGLPSTLEYITFFGGPNTASYTTLAGAFSNPSDSKFQYSNVYDTDIYTTAGLPSDYGSGSRESNLKSDFDNGVTVEFWLKKDAFGSTSTTTKEVVFDMWNNEASGSSNYGRIRVELTGAIASTPFRITALSGTSGIYQQSIGSGLKNSSLETFGHYAICFYNSGSSLVTKLYVNGALNDTNTSAGTLNALGTKNLMGRLGALLTASASPTGPIGLAGSGKLSASVDEFRFWNIKRDSNEIASFYNTYVRGGVNSDISNAALGLYYKFNEGVVGSSDIDSTVLDYSGRLGNGAWTGYGTNSRTTASAIVEAAAATTEYLDPIVYSTHSEVSALKTSLLTKGEYHDSNNNGAFVNLAPSWVLEEDEELTSDLRLVSHIVATYFDKLYLQISALPTFKRTNYTSASATPLPFAQHLPQSLGLYVPELFVDSSVTEKFLNKGKNIVFESDLTETKNLIYLNLYNSLAGIFKSKGTEKAVKNIFRCFNLDDRIIKLKTYSNNQVYELKNNLELILAPNTSINFSNNSNLGAVVFQKADAANPESLGFISGTYSSDKENRYGCTAEANIIFPKFETIDGVVDRNYDTVSLFGMYTANTASAADTTWEFADRANFQVHAIRDAPSSKNVYFKLSSSNSPYPFPELTSSLYFGVYDNEQWNLSVRLRPDNYSLAGVVTGSVTSNYILEFKGINAVGDTIQNSFLLTASIAAGPGLNFLKSAKRLYGGARRTNVTGAVLNKSDVLLTNMKYWTRYLEDADIEQHVYDINNAGVSKAYRNISALDSNLSQTDALVTNTLALHWTFDNITGSDGSGNLYYIQDISSGSQLLRDNYGWIGNIAGYQHTGYGYGFAASSTNVVKKENINSLKFVDPESPVSSNMINIYGNDKNALGVTELPPRFFHVIEKSMYNAISEEMLSFFAGVVDFNNIIGAPVHRYRSRYKSLEKLREIFFRKVIQVSDVEKFIDYYRWLDDALANIISQLMPASSGLVDDTYNTIESHTLERNKYKSQFPTIEFVGRDIEAGATGIRAKLTQIAESLAEGTDEGQERGPWAAKSRAIVANFESSGNPDVDAARQTIFNSISLTSDQAGATLSDASGQTYFRRNDMQRALSAPYMFKIVRKGSATPATIKGGINFDENKNIDFTRNALYPAGPVNHDFTLFIPKNVLVAFASDFDTIKVPVTIEYPNKKIKRHVTVQHGRDWENGIGYSNVKSSYAFPFNIISSSVVSGYNKEVVDNVISNIEITNLHSDAYGPDLDVPMQGPFTNYAVGGHQSRHVSLNTGSDNYLNRPEAWKILLGACVALGGEAGAIGMVGADYPWPEANAVGANPYPMTGAQKAVFYRDHIAKRPVNIRNIQHTVGSTILGNYNHNYEVVSSVGGYSNPRGFVKSPPTLPTQITQTPSASQARSILDIRRSDESHFEFIPAYSIGYFTASTNKSIIRSRFSVPGGIETIGQGYGDIRSNEYSVYNALNYRHLTVLRPFQNISGTVSEATGSGTPGIRVYDIHGGDYGLRTHLARHAGRFGRDSLLVASPGATTDESPAFNKIQRNPLRVIKQNSAGVFYSASQYDNFFVQHQIPRADRQYSWITGSLSPEALGTDLRYYGYAPTAGPQAGYYSSSAAGYTAYFDFVSASSVLGNSGTAPIYQPVLELNIYVDQLVDDNLDNTLGYSLTASVLEYFNTTLLNVFGIMPDLNNKADYFNLLMAKRKSVFGYRGNPQTGPVQHPILRKHRRNNTFTITTSPLQRYTVKPFTNRAQPAIMNMDVAGSNVTLKTSYNNEKIYFGNEDLNDLCFPAAENSKVTAFEQISDIAIGSNSYNLNWVLYAETLFPSRLNELTSGSSTRVGYDNLYWRDAAQGRYDLHTSKIIYNSYGVIVNQSSWPLDAPLNFLTRSAVPLIDHAASNILKVSNSAGELQNEYMHAVPGVSASALRKSQNIGISGLYARKHMLGGPRSVAAPSGMPIPETGSYAVPPLFGDIIGLYAGEALWEASTQAGIVSKNDTTSDFQTASSQPWFSEYADFNNELKFISRGYAIIPEFRISEHIEDYEKYGINGNNKFDTFEIVGTNANSSTSSFYKDYSNSDFMREFLNIRDKTQLDPSEIMLVCSASIRLNPYKGFYPAQRTLQIVNRFKNSYGKSVIGEAGTLVLPAPENGPARPLIQTLFAPGLLYNTIKSGIAVDYPIVASEKKYKKEYYGSAGSTDAGIAWMMASNLTGASDSAQFGYHGGEYWDYRIPFEALMEPERYLANISFFDFEPHPSASLNATASFSPVSSDSIYSKMVSNFFGEIGAFFLKDKTYTNLRSNEVTSDLRFESGSIYGARLKLRRSMSGSRIYSSESGSTGDNTPYGRFGGNYYDVVGNKFEAGVYPLPQDPRQLPSNEFQESFTMYSRPTAFGPAISGRPYGVLAVSSSVEITQPVDSVAGFNWAYTPPYYNGEAWVDFVFEPNADTTYDLERILSETKTAYWRVDPGPSASVAPTGTTSYVGTQLLPTFSGNIGAEGDMIYDGKNVNANAMQISASINCFGVERVSRQRVDKFGNSIMSENETVGMRWVIQPKVETPMLNFNNLGVHPITSASSTLTLPLYASGAVPRGMWHQFGVIEPDASKGIFMEIGEIPKDWLRYHYDVVTNNSIYNRDNASSYGTKMYKSMKPMTDIIKFESDSSFKKLGQLADSVTIREAIVAVPYQMEVSAADQSLNNYASERKTFFGISKETIKACLPAAIGSVAGDSLDSAGESVRRLVDKMQRYVLPPQFDFINNTAIDPMAMYIFEFEYVFDQDDLSYIWQNLAPRFYKKITKVAESTAHLLGDNELLSAEDVLGDDTRWMVFKVKQRSQLLHSDLVTSQAGQSSNKKEIFDFSSTGFLSFNETADNGYPLKFNWPYDYVSFVESVKFDVQVLYKEGKKE